MNIFRIANVVMVAFFFVGCAPEKGNKTAPNVANGTVSPTQTSLFDASHQTSKLDGETVSVRGFLTGLGPIMFLVPDETSDAEKQPSLIVTDDELGAELLLEDPSVELGQYLDSLGCLHHYVDIAGKIGRIRNDDYFGIVEIKSITVFNDNSYIGEGQECYLARQD